MDIGYTRYLFIVSFREKNEIQRIDETLLQEKSNSKLKVLNSKNSAINVLEMYYKC